MGSIQVLWLLYETTLPRVTSFLAVRLGEILWYDILHYIIFIILHILSQLILGTLAQQFQWLESAILSSSSHEKLEVDTLSEHFDPCQGHDRVFLFHPLPHECF